MPRLRSIACAGLAFVMCAVSVAEAAQGISLSVSQKQAGKYERRDLQQGGKIIAWCYPRGTGAWKARFAPRGVGTYTARAVLKDERGEVESLPVTFECAASASKGFLQAGKEDPRFLQFSEGQPFFAIGQNLAFIGEGQYVTLTMAGSNWLCRLSPATSLAESPPPHSLSSNGRPSSFLQNERRAI